MHLTLPSRVASLCGLILGSALAPWASAEFVAPPAVGCAAPAKGERTPVSIAWMVQERDSLRNYRLTIVEEGPSGPASECSLEVQSQGQSAAPARPNVYRVTVLAAPESHLRVRLDAVLDAGPPLLLVEREIVVVESRLNGTTPSRDGDGFARFDCSARLPAPATALVRGAFDPPSERPGRPALLPDPSWVLLTVGNHGPRGPPANAFL